MIFHFIALFCCSNRANFSNVELIKVFYSILFNAETQLCTAGPGGSDYSKFTWSRDQVARPGGAHRLLTATGTIIFSG